MKTITISEGNFATFKGALYLAGASAAAGFMVLVLNAHTWFDLVKACVPAVFALGVFILGQKLEKQPTPKQPTEEKKVVKDANSIH